MSVNNEKAGSSGDDAGAIGFTSIYPKIEDIFEDETTTTRNAPAPAPRTTGEQSFDQQSMCIADLQHQITKLRSTILREQENTKMIKKKHDIMVKKFNQFFTQPPHNYQFPPPPVQQNAPSRDNEELTLEQLEDAIQMAKSLKTLLIQDKTDDAEQPVCVHSSSTATTTTTTSTLCGFSTDETIINSAATSTPFNVSTVPYEHFAKQQISYMPDQSASYQPMQQPPPALRLMQSQIRPPKIGAKNTEHSFHQLEHWMFMSGIHADEHKYQTLLLVIEPETYEAVSSLLLSPPLIDQYETAKRDIIKAFTDSETKNIHKILSELQLGDRRPTQLLQEMCRLYKGQKDSIFRELFLGRLPPNVRGILATAPLQPGNKELPLNTLAQWADNIMEQSHSSLTINAISRGGEKSPEIADLRASIEKLSKQMEKLESQRKGSRSRSTSRSAVTRSRSSSKNEMCWYHKRFGEGTHKNTKCEEDCKLHKEWLAAWPPTN